MKQFKQIKEAYELSPIMKKKILDGKFCNLWNTEITNVNQIFIGEAFSKDDINFTRCVPPFNGVRAQRMIEAGALVEVEMVEVPARDERGHFVADDPETEQDESKKVIEVTIQDEQKEEQPVAALAHLEALPDSPKKTIKKTYRKKKKV